MADTYACPLNVEVDRKALEKLNINSDDTSKTLAWMGGALNTQFSLDTFAATIQVPP
jgi:hypothetical protein